MSECGSINVCKVCAPLGASLAFKGVEGAIGLLHGSQGCATYIRRYLISHFREPVDIASSSFDEQAVIFGGRERLLEALTNVVSQYEPQLVGIATTCLSETIGDDLKSFLQGVKLPCELVRVSTPSYRGTHFDGFHAAVRALVEQLAVEPAPVSRRVNLFPGLISPAEIRHLREIAQAFGLEAMILPDYSESLDGASWGEYHAIAPGGTPLAAIRTSGAALASIQLSRVLEPAESAAELLRERFGQPVYLTGLPLGVSACDRFFAALAEIAGTAVPASFESERGRLIDAYADCHKYVYGRRALVYGDEDWVVTVAAFLEEIGMLPVICATGGQSAGYDAELKQLKGYDAQRCVKDVDMERVSELARANDVEIMIGHSKGYKLARELGVPLVRVGFPVHDRTYGPRLMHLGYRGTLDLFDRVVNALLAKRQDESPVEYFYM